MVHIMRKNATNDVALRLGMVFGTTFVLILYATYFVANQWTIYFVYIFFFLNHQSHFSPVRINMKATQLIKYATLLASLVTSFAQPLE